MNKIAIVAVVGAAFFAGTLLSNTEVAQATGGAWAKMVERIGTLEQLLGGNAIKVVHLEDDESGHAVGWDPQGSEVIVFTITDADVNSASAINAYTNSGIVCVTNEGVGNFLLVCADSVGAGVSDGTSLKYSVIAPQS